MEEVDEPPF